MVLHSLYISPNNIKPSLWHGNGHCFRSGATVSYTDQNNTYLSWVTY